MFVSRRLECASPATLCLLCVLCPLVTSGARGSAIDSTMADANDTYRVEPVRDADAAQVMSFLRRTFYVDEPMNRALELCPAGQAEGACPELDEYCRRALPDHLSLKAVDARGTIVGLIINGLVANNQENGKELLEQAEKCKNPKFQKILYILSMREEGARLWEKYPEDRRMVEVMVAATDSKWRRKGIMNHLLNETSQLVLQRGVRLLRMDTSSAYSAKSAERHGFRCEYSAEYAQLRRGGRPLLQPAPPPPHTHDRVYVKSLQPAPNPTPQLDVTNAPPQTN